MNDTVVILGSSQKTGKEAPFDDKTKDIWIFNSAHIFDWTKRFDVVFQMHSSEIYAANEENLHWKWMKENKKYPIIMQKKDPRVPKAIEYPIDAVTNLLSNFKRGDEVNKYFTSSVCYAIGLAIHYNYKRIEIYGIEMETNSEYIYQRDGVSLWIGIAISKGIEVVLPKSSIIFDAPRYGYDTGKDFNMTIMDVEERGRDAQIQVNKFIEILETKKKNYESALQNPQDTDEIQKAKAELDQANANMIYASGILDDCLFWFNRIKKKMAERGKAQEIFAMNENINK